MDVKDDVPFDFDPFSIKKVNPKMRNMAYLPITYLGKRLTKLTFLPKLKPFAYPFDLGYMPATHEHPKKIQRGEA